VVQHGLLAAGFHASCPYIGYVIFSVYSNAVYAVIVDGDAICQVHYGFSKDKSK
jgi:hypothetical protein